VLVVWHCENSMCVCVCGGGCDCVSSVALWGQYVCVWVCVGDCVSSLALCGQYVCVCVWGG